MDVETALFVVSAALAAFWSTVIGVLHIRGWLPQAYTTRLAAIQSSAATQIGLEVERALRAVAASQEAKYEEAARAAQADVQSSVKSAEMSIVRSVGVDRAMRAGVDRALSEAILGPALPLLRQFAPGLADQLEENPQLVDILLEHPLFKKYVEPRIRQFLGKPAESGGSDVNPFLKELGQ